MRFLRQLLRGHWSKLLMLAAAAVAVVVLPTVPARAGSAAKWRSAFAWAGFRRHLGSWAFAVRSPAAEELARESAQLACSARADRDAGGRTAGKDSPLF